MSTATLVARRPKTEVETRLDYYSVVPESRRESAIEALMTALIAQKSSSTVAGYGLLREAVSGHRSIERLSRTDAIAMRSIGEARVPEYTADDTDLFVDDDD